MSKRMLIAAALVSDCQSRGAAESNDAARRVANLRRRSRPTPATRHSIRSPPPTSTSSRSPGDSRPTASVRVLNSISSPRRSWSTAALYRPAARGARWSRGRGHRRTAVDAQRARGRTRSGGAATALGPRPGLLERRQGGANSTSRPATGSSRSTRRPVSRCRLRPERHRRLKQDIDQEIDLATAPVGLACHSDGRQRRRHRGRGLQTGSKPKSKTNHKGHIRGYDVRTGKRLWIFHTIPQPNEFGNGAWLKNSWDVHRQRRCVGRDVGATKNSVSPICQSKCRPATTTAACDPATTCSAKASWRSTSETGQRKWHYQLIHHGIWDRDIPAPPILADITVNGRAIKALAQPTKQALLYVLNRETGEPVWPIEERSVPKATHRANGIRPHSHFRPSPRPTKAKAFRSTI